MEDDDAVAKKQSEELKQQGNVAYKARKFDEAIEAYQKAWDTWPKDVTYLTNLSGESVSSAQFGCSDNLAAVYFEQGDYNKCIEVCEKAVEEGRDLRADYKIFAK
jgi:stress-induced-phosphoprotein 1